MKNKLLLLLLAYSFKISSQCISDDNNVFSFAVDNVPYELIKENKTWMDAAACAASRGGKLAEINSKAEQDTVFYYLNQAGILPANTVAPDGGGASYVWLGGNDMATEGKWIWDGINSGSINQFWQGNSNGSPVGGSYSNWGNEPDNWNGQDGLGLAVTNWPLGIAGQWNDIKETNQLYYIIEYPKIITTSVPELKSTGLFIYPNPAIDFVNFKTNTGDSLAYTIRNGMGSIVRKGTASSTGHVIDLRGLTAGMYLLNTDKESIRLVKTE